MDTYLCANYKEEQRKNKAHNRGNGDLRDRERNEVSEGHTSLRYLCVCVLFFFFLSGEMATQVFVVLMFFISYILQVCFLSTWYLAKTIFNNCLQRIYHNQVLGLKSLVEQLSPIQSCP